MVYVWVEIPPYFGHSYHPIEFRGAMRAGKLSLTTKRLSRRWRDTYMSWTRPLQDILPPPYTKLEKRGQQAM